MWLTASLERSEPNGELRISDHDGVALHSTEEGARACVKADLRQGDSFVGLFKLEGVYTGDITVRQAQQG